MTTEPDQKGTEVKSNADITAKDEEEVVEIRRSQKGKRKNSEDLREHVKHLSDMVMTNMQTPRPTLCAMLPII